MSFCKVEGCENYCEGGTDQCGSHNAMDRKLAKMAIKEKKIYVIPKVSEKLAPLLRLYYKKKEEYLKKYPNCQIKLIGCTNKAYQVHHSAKRGKNLTNEDTFMSACMWCHDIVETKLSAKERRENGFLK